MTVAKLSLWSVNYYNDTARAVGQAAKDARSAGGGLAEYYAERDTRTPVWTCVGDTRRASNLVGLSDSALAGGDADPEVVARWLDAGVAPSGECGRAHGKGGVHGFDLTFCAPKSVSLVRAFGDEIIDKAVSAAHQTAIAEALEYLHQHAGYTRVHNPITGLKDLQKLPGLVAASYQHETSRAGIRICTLTSWCPTAKPARTANWCRLTAPVCSTKPARPGSFIRPRCATNYTGWRWNGVRWTRARGWPRSPEPTPRTSRRGRRGAVSCGRGRRRI